MSAKDPPDTRDLVLPISNLDFLEESNLNTKTAELVGTCFLIGGRGYALTAGHVIDQIRKDRGYVLIRNGTKWDASLIYESEVHPNDDVGIVRFDHTRSLVSPIQLSDVDVTAGQDYHMWSYPEETASEVKNFPNHSASFASFRPAIVFFRGYVRRSIYHNPNPNISIYRGERYYEISEVAGACASGSPVLTPEGRVFAIYVGENSNRCGYASMLSSALSWSPTVLGHSILEEAT